MKLSLPNDVYIVRETGLPVEGRMKVYLHESDTYADVFTLEGADYVQAENPQLLHVGLPEASLFTDTGVYDIVIEQYIGPEGAMSVESPDEDFAKVDEFQWGLDFNPEAYTANRVDTIAELRQLDPSLKAVTVLWYSEAGDCFPRTYWWDGAAVNDEDGGYVISSEVSDTGRWILMWGDSILPASVYGVTPGDTANMNLLLNYPATVGSFALKTAPIVRFPAGNYSTGVDYATDKDLMFDTGSKFLDTEFVCPRAIIPGSQSDFVADFSFTGDNVTAHSSWFRTVESWWHCGASTMVIDDVNHFTATTLKYTADLLGVTIIGDTRIPTSFLNGAYLKVRNCNILGRHIFSPSQDYLQFSQMKFTTDWFTATNPAQYDFGLISGGHRTECRTAMSNTLDFEDFASPNVYYLARLANGDTEFDGHGATYSSFTVNDQFTSISNCRVPSMVDHKCGEWENVFVEGGLNFSTGGASVITMKGCSFYLSEDLSTRITAISLDNCNVRTGAKWRTSTRIAVSNSTFAATCELAETAKTNRTLAQMLSFDHCTLDIRSNYIWTNNLSITHCTSNAHVYLVPYLDGETYRMSGTFVDNLFVQGALIECNVKNMSEEYDVRNVYAALTFKDNRFDQEDNRGIVIPWLTQEMDFLKPFLATGSGALSVYKNNTGKCPAEQPTKLFLASAMVGSQVVAGGLHYLPPATYRQRVWNLNSQTYWYPGLMGIQFEPSSDSWNKINGRDARAHYGALMHIAREFPTDAENDQFGVVHAWEDNDGFDADLEVFYF